MGMASACAMQFESRRTDPTPHTEALKAEAWATLGVVLERTGTCADALAALQRAVTLEPDNWRHQVRLALGSCRSIRW
jgi:Flp pilus assembly protein TadD